MRGVESILRSVNDLYRACTVMQQGGGGVYCPCTSAGDHLIKIYV